MPRTLNYRQLAAAGLVLFAISQLWVVVWEQVWFLLIFATVAVIGAFVVSRFDRAWASAVALVIAILAVVSGMPFIMFGLAHFRSAMEFIPAALGLAGAVPAIVFAALDLLRRRQREPEGAHPTAASVFAGVAGIVIALSVVSLVLTFTTADEVSAGDREGAREVRLREVKFDPEELALPAGREVKVFIDNEDRVTHTFTIEGTDVDEEIRPLSQKVLTFTLQPGEYKLQCEVPGHETMDGSVKTQ